MRLRGALVGCGMISEFHLRAWQRIPEVEIVALVDSEVERAVRRRDEFAPQTATFREMRDMLNHTNVDFVDVLTPPWLHREHCLLAAEHEVHIICQKPLCDQLEEAQTLTKELSAYPKAFCVHENHPYRPWFREVSRLHREGIFGDALKLELVQREAMEPPERFKTEAEKGIMLDYGIHFVAMGRSLFGEPANLKARLERINPRVRGESLARVLMEFSNATASIEVAWQDHGSFEGRFVLTGSRAEARFDGSLTRGDTGRFKLIRDGKISRDEPRIPAEDFKESFYLFQRDFIDCVLGQGPLPQPASDNLKTLKTTFAVYDAATGESVSQPDPILLKKPI